jgi:hypothetical protein
MFHYSARGEVAIHIQWVVNCNTRKGLDTSTRLEHMCSLSSLQPKRMLAHIQTAFPLLPNDSCISWSTYHMTSAPSRHTAVATRTQRDLRTTVSYLTSWSNQLQFRMRLGTRTVLQHAHCRRAKRLLRGTIKSTHTVHLLVHHLVYEVSGSPPYFSLPSNIYMCNSRPSPSYGH